MESVTEYYPGKDYRTRVLITADGRKEMRRCVHPNVAGMFEGRAEKGFHGYIAPALRKEGKEIWAFGPQGETSRICGYFLDDSRKDFVITGAWKGKHGSGNARPHDAEAIVARTERIKREGVQLPETANVQEPSTAGRSGRGPQDSQGQEVL